MHLFFHLFFQNHFLNYIFYFLNYISSFLACELGNINTLKEQVIVFSLFWHIKRC